MTTAGSSAVPTTQPEAVASAIAAPHPRTAGGWRTTWIARHRLGVFIVLAFALSWWPWPLAVLKPDSTAMVSFGPIIAALGVAALAGGARQVLPLLRAVVRWRVPWTRYAVALGGPFLLATLVGVLAVAFGVVAPGPLGATLDWSTLPALPALLAASALIGGPLFEEVGWRGVLLKELQRRRTALTSTLIVGVVWAAWHLPLLVSEPTGQRPPLPFVVWVLGQAVVLAWIYNTSHGSVLLVILGHAAANVSGRLLLEPYVGQDGYLIVWWLLAACYVAVAALLIWRTRGRLGLQHRVREVLAS